MRFTSRLVSFISRHTLWSEGKVFVVAPEQFDLIEGVRAALSIGLLLVGAIGLDYPDLSFGAVAAFWTCLCDPFGSAWSRLETMARFALLGTAVFTLSSFGASFGSLAATATLFGLVALCCLGRTYAPTFGPGPAQASFISAIAVVVGVATPRPLGGALELGACFLFGATLTILISTMIWPNRINVPARLMLVTIYGRLQKMLADLIVFDRLSVTDSSAWIEYETSIRRGVRISIERGRQIVARRLLGSPSHGHALDVAGRLLAALIALGQWRKAKEKFSDDDVSLLLDLDELLRQVINCFDDGAMTSAKIRQQALALQTRAAVARNTLLGKCVVGSAIALMSLAETATGEPRREVRSSNVLASMFGTLTWPPSVVWRHALRVTAAVTACQIVGLWAGVTMSYWGTIATLVVLQPVLGNTWARVIERATGSLLGGVLAALLLMNNPGHLAMSLMIIPLAAAVISVRTVNYALFTIFLTPMFMLLSDFVRPAEGLILLRAVNESLGALFGIGASMLIFPTNDRVAISEAVRAAVSANLTFAAGVLRFAQSTNSSEIAKVQADAGVTSSRAEAAAAVVSLHNGSADALKGVLSALRTVCGAAAVFEILDEGDLLKNEQRAEYYEIVSSALQMQLRTRAVREVPIPSRKAYDLLDEAVADLALAVQSLVHTYARDGGSVARSFVRH